MASDEPNTDKQARDKQVAALLDDAVAHLNVLYLWSAEDDTIMLRVLKGLRKDLKRKIRGKREAIKRNGKWPTPIAS